MFQTSSIKEKYKRFLLLVVPVLITQLGLYAMNFFDTVMSGHSGANQLAGVAIGSSLWVPVFTGLNGILMALTPIVSQLEGARNDKHVPNAVTQAVYLAVMISISVIAVGFLILDPVLQSMSLENEVERVAKGYLIALSFGIVPLFIYGALRSFIDALGHTRITMVVTLIALPVNVFFNYLFIFGKAGFPELGGIGAGVATAISYWITAFFTILILYKWQPFIKYQLFRTFYKPSLKAWKAQLKIGVPIGFSIFFEVSIFAAVTLLMSDFNTVTIAAHQAALNFASFLYMLPLSIAMALTIAVGFEVGAKRYKDAAQYSVIGIITALGFAVVFSALLLIFDEQVASIYSNQKDVIQLTTSFLWFAVFFQLADAIGAPIQGALRGYKDVNVTFFLSFISYWVLGLPVGYYLANYTSHGAYGYWIGLISGLSAGAIILFLRLKYIQSHTFSSGRQK
ncbi:MATE family efflux transporter [Fictibacillus barbaricus]|uniref:Probable multidrug resistance protein NorM n=1 Tax=Fictibacillus barbaricus TaxID=182136 RepID=A0ABU1TYP9_9BACL|nr:MATE family efflux transporter [Fictibacillus barbaricus]MDR7072345.1 MATE family multidrug resistance protein [Fictibacillus barbaricus]